MFDKDLERIKRGKGNRPGGFCFNYKGIYLFMMLLIITTLLSTLCCGVQGRTMKRVNKKALKLLQNPSSSLIQARHKRDTYSNEEQSDYYDDNYDVLPDDGANGQPPTFGEHISAQAQKVAESFKNMWQSLTDSVQHCMEGLRAMFADPNEDLTPEEEAQLLKEMEEEYRRKQEQENAIE